MINSYYIDEKNLMEKYNAQFCFITSSYNQSQFITGNLESIILQNYKLYRIIYINDASTDNSLDILNEFIENHTEIDITLITNKIRLGPAGSRFIACNKTRDDEICVFLDGDDTLYSKNVLSIIAHVYQNPNIHATFGSMIKMRWIPVYERIYTRSNERNFFPHLRTAKAYYCKKIPENYLKDKNKNWYMFCTDIALFTAIIELINYNYVFIKNPLMVYNTHNNDNNSIEGFTNQNSENRKIRDIYHRTIKYMRPLAPIINDAFAIRRYSSKFLIIRILGNDLPGIHGDKQTFENLLFTLKHEVQFVNTDKIYVLNRIIDTKKKIKIQKLLYSKKIKYIDIPFNKSGFEELPLLHMNINKFKKISNRGKIIKLLYSYNQILINNNGCRNFCIKYGNEAGYLWTFVLDSNSFFTESSYNGIINNIKSDSDIIIIPQKRLKDMNYNNNDILIDPDIENKLPIQEPQIAFKASANGCFNPNIPYGAAPKAEFLNALGVKGRWNKWGDFLKYLDIIPRKIDNISFQVCESVLRLHPYNESNKMEFNWNKRMEGLFILVKKLQRRSNIIFHTDDIIPSSDSAYIQSNHKAPEKIIEPEKPLSNLRRFFN